MADYAAFLNAARGAVMGACHICREVQGGRAVVSAMTKDDRSPVTIADFAAQALIVHSLRERLGNVRMVAEETSTFLRRPERVLDMAAVVGAARGAWPEATEESVLEAIDSAFLSPGGTPTSQSGSLWHGDRGAGYGMEGFWTLDPIDGTKGFVRGQQYAVCLAYIESGVPVVAVMGCPNLARDLSAPVDEPDPVGSMYFSIKGGGVYETGCSGDPDIDGAPIRLTRLEHDTAQPFTLCEAVEVGRRDSDAAAAVAVALGGCAGVLRLDSQCKYAVVARGQADAFVRMPNKNGRGDWIWDHAPGALIAAEAGCAVTDVDANQYDFSAGSVISRNRGTVAAPPRLHGRIIGAIAELGLATPRPDAL